MSKGGDSSDSATTQTPAQWAAALSNTSIAAWKEADILAISLDKLQALSATQISQITVPWALPGAVWTADTLNAVPLQYWGAFGPRYLSTTSNGVTTVSPFSQLSAVASGSASSYSNWFADLGYSYQSGAGRWTFSPSVVAGISTERIARIGSGLGTASQAPALNINNGVVDTSAFEVAVTSANNKGESVKTWSFPISDAESVAGITKRSVVMFGAGWSDMGADFMGALTASQLGAIAHAEDVLGATQLGYLSANQLIALRQMDWSRVSAAQLNGINLEAFSGLQSNIITAISEAAWRGLDKAHTQKLNAANIRLLSASKIGALQYLGYALTASVGAILTANQVASIQSGCWAQVSDTSFLNALPLSVMQSIAPSAFASMSTAVIAGMDGLHLGALTDAQALVFPLSALNDASVAFYRNPNTLNFNDFVNNQTVNWARAPASFIKLLTLEQLKLLNPSQMAQLSLAAVAGLTRSQTQALTLAQIQAFSTAQLSAAVYISRRIDVVSQIFGVFTVTRMSTAFWSRVDSSFLNALSLSAFAAITSAQMAAISSDVFAGLDKAHFDAFTITQLLALTAQQVGAFRGEYLTIYFLRNVRLDSFKGLVPEQMRRLHDYLFNTVATNAFADGDPVLLATAEHQFASLLATIMDSDDGREAWLQQSVDLLIRLQWLDVAAAATLSASDVQNTYAALNWSWMSGSFLNSITTAVFSQVKASSIAQLNLSAVAALNDAHIQALTVTQAAALTGEQLSAITHLGALQATVVQSLTTSQIAGISQDWSQISNIFLSNMTPRQFIALTPSQFGQMSAAQLAASAIDWRLISPEQINALSLAEFSKLCTGSDPAILRTTTGVLLGLNGEQTVILSQAVSHYSTAQVSTLLNLMLGAFSADHADRMIELMKNDGAEQIVLQTGLIALLAQIDGSATGIDTAIQSLVSLRSIQPSWFNTDNLSTVLSVLSQRYSDFTQLYNSSVVPQNLFNYTFSSGAVARLRTLDTIPRLLQETQQRVNNIDFAPLIQRLAAVEGGLNVFAFKLQGQGIIRPVLQPLGALQASLIRANDTELVDFAVLSYVYRRMTDYLIVQGVALGPRDIPPALTPEQIAGLANTANRAFTEDVNLRLRAAEVDSIPKAQLAQRAAATQTVLALGGLLVMLGVGIGDFGRAIEAASNRHLSSKERDDLIASASLSALASIALGLQMPLTKVLERLVQRYIAAKFAGQEVPQLDVPRQQQARLDAALDDFEQLRQANIAQEMAARPVAEPAALPPNRVPSLVGDIPLEVDLRGPLPDNVRVGVADNPQLQQGLVAAATRAGIASAELKNVIVQFEQDPVIDQAKVMDFQARYGVSDGGQYPVTDVRGNFTLAAVGSRGDAQSRFSSFLSVAREMVAVPPVVGDARNLAKPVLLRHNGQGQAIILVATDAANTAVQLDFNGLRLSRSVKAEVRVTGENLQALVRDAATKGIVITRSNIYNVTQELPVNTSSRINNILTSFYQNGRRTPVSVADQNFILQHLEDFVWTARNIQENARAIVANNAQYGDSLAWRGIALNALRDILGVDAQLNLEAQPEFKDISDKVTQVINEAQVSLGRGQVPIKIIDDVVLYATLATFNDQEGRPILNESLLSKANKLLSEQRATFGGLEPQLSLADVTAATQRLTTKLVLNAAKANVLAKVTIAYYDNTEPRSLPGNLRDALLSDVRASLGLGPYEANPIMDSFAGYELRLAVAELTGQTLIRRMQGIVDNQQLSDSGKAYQVRRVLGEVFDFDVDSIKATPALRDYLSKDLPLALNDGNVAPRAVNENTQRAVSFLGESLASGLSRRAFEGVIEVYYEGDVTDARFTDGLTAAQIKAMETPDLDLLRRTDFAAVDIPEEYQGDVARLVRDRNQLIEAENNRIKALQRGLSDTIKANKKAYFANLPEEEQLWAKVKYFLSVDNAERMGYSKSLITDQWVDGVRALPANEDSVAILEGISRLGTKSLSRAIDSVFLSGAFGASAEAVAGYQRRGGIAAMMQEQREHYTSYSHRLGQEIQGSNASQVRGQLLDSQFAQYRSEMRTAASKQASWLGSAIEFKDSASTPLVPEVTRKNATLIDQVLRNRPLGFDANGNVVVKPKPTLRPVPAQAVQPLAEVQNVGFELAIVLAKIAVDSTLTRYPDIDFATDQGSFKLGVIADRIVGPLRQEGAGSNIDSADFPGLYAAVIKSGLALTADGGLNKVARINMADFVAALTITLRHHPTQAIELAPEQQQKLLGILKQSLHLPKDAGSIVIDSGLRTLINIANTAFTGDNADYLSLGFFRDILAQIIVKRSLSYAPYDLSLTTKAVLQEVQRGDFSRLPGIYDAVAQARLGTVANWQEKLSITNVALADNIADVINHGNPDNGIKRGNVDADLLLQTLNESVFIADDHAIARALNNAVEAVTRTSRAELQSSFTAGATAAEGLARTVEVNPSEAFANFLAVRIVEQALVVGNLATAGTVRLAANVKLIINDLGFRAYKYVDREALRAFAREQQIVLEGEGLNKVIAIDVDNLSQAIIRRLNTLSIEQTGNPWDNNNFDAPRLAEALTVYTELDAASARDFISGLQGVLEVADPVDAPLFGRDGPPARAAGAGDAVAGRAPPRVPEPLPENAPVELRAVVVEAAGEADALGRVREAGVGRGEFQLSRMQIAVSGVVTLSFALFASVVGIAAGIAGLIYAAQSSHLSAQAQALALAMNGVRVLSSFIMLGASVAQIASNVAKAVQVVADTTSIANAGFLIGNVIGITTNVAQIGIQIKAATDATDDTSRLIAGLAILDATIQLILNIVGTIALAFGPIGVIVNLVTFIIAALLPSAAAIATAVKYRESYDDLTSKGLFKEAEVIYMQWQTAALDASPIVNWTSSIYTPEMKKAQERLMDNAWMDKSGEERLLYALKNNTDLKSNFDNLRAQMYAGTAALNQSFVNLGQGLTRAVTLMLSQENLSYFEGDKLATVKLAATFNYLTNTVSRAPKLVSAAVNGQLVTLTFNQNLSSLNSQLPNLSAFTVKVAGVATTVSGFSLLNNTITLTLASVVSAGQVVTFSYSDTTTGDDSHAVQNLLGKDAASITDHAVVNSLDADHRAPLLVDAVVEDKYLSLLFDEGLDSAVGKVPDKTAFAVTVAGSNAAIESVAVSGQRVLLTLVDKVAVGAVVSFNYTAGEQGLRDTAGNKVLALSAQAVDNTSSTATVGASRVGWLQYDNFVASTQGTGSEAASVLNGADYTVYANDAGANAGTARLRYLSLSNAAGEFDMYSASRATENSDRIWLDASSAQGLSNFAINTSGMTVWGGQGKNSYSLSRQYANSSYIVAANSWSSDSNVVSLSGGSDDSNHVVNLDYLLTADNISGGLAVTQTPFKVLGSADGLDEVIGSADNQTYYATSNVANVRLTGANANLFVGESATVSVGLNARVLVDMDMWRGLSLSRPTAGVTNATINGSYGSYSLLNLAATDTVNDSFIGKLDLRYQIGHLPTLGAFTVNAGGANVAVTQMKISGSKVTLSLASAVQQNQAVRVSYQDVSASNDADTLQDLAGNDVGNFSAQVVSNVTADTTAPTLKVATVQGSSLIVRFSEALLQAVKPLASDFTVKVAGTAVAVSKVAFNDSSSLLLTLASPVSAGQTVSMGYSVASDTTVAVQDLAGNASSGFTNASVVNLASVTVAPGLRSVTANGNVLTLKFDGTLRYTLSDASAFLVTADNTPMTISSVSVVGTSVLLYLASAVTSEQLVEVSYTAPQQASDTTTLRDWLGNGVGNLSAQVATNITAQDLTAPTLQYAIVNGNSLVLTFSETLNSQAGFTPVPSAFAVRVAGSTVSVTQAVVSGATVTLSLATAVDYAAAVSLSYTDLSASNDVAVVQDLAGNDAESFSNINVVNNTPNTTAPSLLSAMVTENQLVLLFDDSLNNNVGYLPPLTSMSVNAAGVAVGIVSGSLNGDTATLTLSRAVNPDDYVTFNYSAPASSSSIQAFQDWSGNPLLSIANFSVSNLTGVDLTPPSFVSAEVNGNTLSLTFSEALASTASFTPGLNAFSVYVDGSLNTVSAVTLNGTQAVLSLNRAVSKEQVVTVSYSQPANRPIQDGAGNFTASFSGKAVSNVTVDTSAPTLSSASVAGALLTLTFNENLATDTSLIPSAKQFAVNVDGAVVDVLSAVVAGKVVTVTLNKAVTAAQAVSVDYTPATTGTNQLQDASGNATVRFSKTVSNWSGLASLQNATVSGTQLTLTFNQELDAISGHLPPVSAFAVQVAGVNSTVSQLVANGYKLTLTLDAAVNYGQTVTVNYTDPSTANDVAALQNLAGMDVQTFTEAYAVHNLTPQVTDLLAPSLNSAVANGSTVTLTFSEALDAGVGEWLVNYLPNGQYDAQGNPVVTSRLQASGFVNVLGSNSNDSFIIGDQSDLAASRQLNYIQLGNGQGVKVSHYDTSGNLLLAMGNTGQADVVLESGSSLQKLLTTKLVQSDADIVKYKANRDTVTLKTLSSLTAFLAGYEVIDATESSSSLTAQIGGGDHQIKLGGQTVNLQFDKAVSTTSITTDQIPNSWLDYQYFNFNSINADGLWVGRESDGTVLFQAKWTNATSGSTDNLKVSYDGTLSNVVMGVGHVLASAASSQLRLDKLIEVMATPSFASDAAANSHAMMATDTSNDGAQTKLYRISDIVAYSAQPQSAVTAGV